MSELGYVQTVLGRVRPAELGIVLPHEHLLFDLIKGASSVVETLQLNESAAVGAFVPEAGWERGRVSPGTAASWVAKWDEPITLENLADFQRNFFYYGHGRRQLSVEDAIHEVRLFKLAGGGCIVDASVTGMARDPAGLQRIARATGIHVVMTSGYYLETYHPPGLREWSEDQVYEQLLQEVQGGVVGVFPGMLKGGLHYPIRPGERKVLRAAARAQATTGLALTIHPGSSDTAPLEAVRIVEEAGGDPTRTVVQHLEHRIFDLDGLLELAKTGCYLSFDNFGRESSSRQRGPQDLPNDAMRLNLMAGLAARGHEKQLLISHDAGLKFQLHKWGGLGYDHILLNVVPLMRYKGFSKDLIQQILVQNPARMLATND